MSLELQDDLEDAFAAGLLIRPAHERANLVHLVRALAHLAGAEDIDRAGRTAELADLIGPSEHLVFVLLDGLGMNIVRRLPAESFLASSLRRELSAPCPSTTAAALTCLATAHYPNRHGVTGWFTHLPEFGLTAVTLPFLDRATGRPLGERGIRPEDVLAAPPVAPRLARPAMTFVPYFIANSTYNTWSRGGTAGCGFETIPKAIDAILAHVAAAAGPTYTHLYLPDVDSLCHKLGVDHPSILPLVMQIDAELARLRRALGSGGKIVVTADHGLIDVPRGDQILLFEGDPLLALLQVPPSGDARMPVFHVKPGRREAFAELFHQRFGGGMFLIETREAERLELFGPGAWSEPARQHFGDYVAIPYRPTTLAYHPPGRPVGELFHAVHAGLSPQEMEIPLCVAGGEE